MNIFEMWLYGVKVIISFIPIGIGMIVLPILIYFSFDLFIEAMFGEAMFIQIFWGCKTYGELWAKIKRRIKKHK